MKYSRNENWTNTAILLILLAIFFIISFQIVKTVHSVEHVSFCLNDNEIY